MISLEAPSARAPWPIGSTRFWCAYLVTMRPYLCFVSGAAGALGLALGPAPRGPGQLAALAALFLSYGFGQALTDVFQIDTDSRSAPYRPLCRGEVRGQSVLVVSLLGLAACGTAVSAASAWAMLPALLGVGGLASYRQLKRHWWGGPAWNSAVVALLPVIGALAAGMPARATVASLPLWLAAASVFFSYAVFVIVGYLKDVEADRQTGYDTLAVHFGRRTSVVHSSVAAALALASSLALVLIAAPRSFSFAALGGMATWATAALLAARAHVRAWAVRKDDDAHPAVADSVRAFVLLHAAELVLLRPGAWGLCVAAALVVGFEVTLARRPETRQI